jgi:hypothetical protein
MPTLRRTRLISPCEAHAFAVALRVAKQFALDAHIALIVGLERGETAQ